MGDSSEGYVRDTIAGECIQRDMCLHVGVRGKADSEESNRKSLKTVVQLMKVKSAEATFCLGRDERGRKQSLFQKY